MRKNTIFGTKNNHDKRHNGVQDFTDIKHKTNIINTDGQ